MSGKGVVMRDLGAGNGRAAMPLQTSAVATRFGPGSVGSAPLIIKMRSEKNRELSKANKQDTKKGFSVAQNTKDAHAEHTNKRKTKEKNRTARNLFGASSQYKPMARGPR